MAGASTDLCMHSRACCSTAVLPAGPEMPAPLAGSWCRVPPELSKQRQEGDSYSPWTGACLVLSVPACRALVCREKGDGWLELGQEEGSERWLAKILPPAAAEVTSVHPPAAPCTLAVQGTCFPASAMLGNSTLPACPQVPPSSLCRFCPHLWSEWT